VGDAAGRPQPAQLLGAPIGLRVAAFQRHAVQFVLGHPVAGADTEVEPAVRDQVDQRRLLGDLGRVVQRGDDDRGAVPIRTRAVRAAMAAA